MRDTVTGSTSRRAASFRPRRCWASCASFAVEAMRTTLFSKTLSRPLLRRMMSSAWSHGTLSRTMVTLPATLGSRTKFRPEISWNRRKTCFRSASTSSRLMRRPVYIGRSPDMVLDSKVRPAAGFTPGRLVVLVVSDSASL